MRFEFQHKLVVLKPEGEIFVCLVDNMTLAVKKTEAMNEDDLSVDERPTKTVSLFS